MIIPVFTLAKCRTIWRTTTQWTLSKCVSVAIGTLEKNKKTLLNLITIKKLYYKNTLLTACMWSPLECKPAATFVIVSTPNSFLRTLVLFLIKNLTFQLNISNYLLFGLSLALLSSANSSCFSVFHLYLATRIALRKWFTIFNILEDILILNKNK